MTTEKLTLEQVLEGVTAEGMWEVGGPYPEVSLIYLEHSSTGGDSPAPPVYEPIATFFEANGLSTPDPIAQRDAAYAARACSNFPALVRILQKIVEADKAAISALKKDFDLHPDLNGDFQALHNKTLAVLAEALKA